MPTKKQLQEELTQLRETIQGTIILLENLIETPNYITIRRRGWNLGWVGGIYHAEILEDNFYDTQALHLASKILGQILDTEEEQ